MTAVRPIMRSAIALAALVSFAGPAAAAPLSLAAQGAGAGITASENPLVQKVSGCHKGRANHMVYKWGFQAWHRHGGNCKPIQANPPGSGGPGGGGKYCHRQWKKHFHPGWGGGWHKHVGPNCKPRKGKVWKGGSRKNCLNIAGIWICG